VRKNKEPPLADVERRARESRDTVAKPLDGGALNLVGNAHAGEGHRGGVISFTVDCHGSKRSLDRVVDWR
jgi:hypothetical protein